MIDGSLLTVIEILRSQILEVHHSLEQSLLGQTVRRTSSRFKTDETRRTMVRVSVTCIEAATQTLHIEELSRLLSLADSLKTTFEVLTRPNSHENAEIEE